MTHIAHQRIRKGGKYYAPGEPIELTGIELAALPQGVVSEADDVVAAAADTAVKLAGALTNLQPEQPLPRNDRAARLELAVAGLLDTDFKKDGAIRTDSLKLLNETLGFDVTAEEIAGIRATKAGGEPI